MSSIEKTRARKTSADTSQSGPVLEPLEARLLFSADVGILPDAGGEFPGAISEVDLLASLADTANLHSVDSTPVAVAPGFAGDEAATLEYAIAASEDPIFSFEPELADNRFPAAGLSQASTFESADVRNAPSAVAATDAESFLPLLLDEPGVPVVTVGSGTVFEGQSVVLTTGMLSATDLESGPAELIYTVTQNSSGYFELLSEPGVAVTSFSQLQIDSGQVVYFHDGSESAIATFNFSVVDDGGTGQSPATGTFTMDVTPVNDPPLAENFVRVMEQGVFYNLEEILTFNDPEGDGLSAVWIESFPADFPVPLTPATMYTLAELNTMAFVWTGTWDPESNNQMLEYRVVDDGGTANGGSDQNAVVSTVSLLTPPGTTYTGYTEDTPPVILDPYFTVLNPDADVDGAQLVVPAQPVFGAGEILSFIDGNNVSVTAADISYDFGGGPLVIGSYSGGAGFDDLVINFNSNATVSSVEAVGRQISFSTNDDPLQPFFLREPIEWVLTETNSDVIGIYSSQHLLVATAVNDSPTALNDSYHVAEGGTLDTSGEYPLHETSLNVGSPNSIFADDIDSDGDADLLTTSHNSLWLSWGENDGLGNFTRHNLITDGGRPLYAESIDLDLDGDIDILATFAQQTNNVVWYENDGSQNFTAHAVTETSGDMLKIADIDSDGDLDVALSAGSTVEWFENDGAQSFTQHQVVAGVTGANSIEIADLDGDGDQDLLVPQSGDNQIVWYENDGSQNFSNQLVGTQLNPQGIAVADINNDGYLDVYSVTTDSADRTLRWHMNDGAQSFTQSNTAHLAQTMAANTSTEVVDLDADGDLDVLITSAWQDATWLFTNDGTGTLASTLIDNTVDFPVTITAADVDSDGDLDVVTNGWNSPAKIRWHEAIDSVLLNDFDVDSDDTLLSVALVDEPLHGVVSLGADGNFTYSHDGSENSNDSFTYQTLDDDDGVSSVATVSLNIIAVNDAPELITNNPMAVNEGDVDQVIGNTLLSAADVDNSAVELSYRVSVLPANGVLSVGGMVLAVDGIFSQDDLDNNRVTYSHDGGETISDNFQFYLSDGISTTAAQQFSILVEPVNDAPVITNLDGDILGYTEEDGAIVIDQNIAAIISDVDSTDYDGFTLQASIVSGGNVTEDSLGLRHQGNATAQVGFSNGSVTYEGVLIGEAAGGGGGTALSVTFNGNATKAAVSAVLGNVTYQNSEILSPTTSNRVIQFLVSDADSAASIPYNASVTVTDTNELPETVDSLLANGHEDDSSIPISVSGSDMDGTADQVRVVSLPLNGTLYVSAALSTPVRINTDYALIGGSRSFFFVPDLNWNGFAAFTYATVDNEGGIDPTPAIAGFTVASINNAPQLSAGTVTDLVVAEDSGVSSLGLESLNYTPGGGADETGQALSYQVTSVPGSELGQVILANDVVVSADNYYTLAEIRGMRFSAATDAHGGPETFSFVVSDDGFNANEPAPQSLLQSLNITVSPVNDVPELVTNSLHVTEGEALLITKNALAATDVESAPGELIFHVSDATNGGFLVDSASGTSFTQQDILDSRVVFLHDGSESIPSFNVSVSDGVGDSVELAANVSFSHVNDSPFYVGNFPVNTSAVEDLGSRVDLTDLTVGDVDIANGNLTLTASTQGGTLVAVNTSDLGITGNDTSSVSLSGSLTAINSWLNDYSSLFYIGVRNNHGLSADSIEVTISDNGNTVNGGGSPVIVGRIDVDIVSVNDAPAGGNSVVNMLEDTGYIFTATDFNFTDVTDGNQLLSVLVTSLPGRGTLLLDGVAISVGQSVHVNEINAGSFLYQPAQDGNGPGYAGFGFRVQDDGGVDLGGVDLDTTVRTITINVNGVNDPPAGVDNTVSTYEDTGYVFRVADFGFNDHSDGNAFANVVIDTLPAAGTLLLSGQAVEAGDSITVTDIDSSGLVFSPAANQHGAGYAGFSFRVQDNNGTANDGSDTDIVSRNMTVDVFSVSDRPVVADNIVVALEDSHYTFRVQDFPFTDHADYPANSLQSVVVDALPASGELLLDGVPVVQHQIVSAQALSSGRLQYLPEANANGNNHDSLMFIVIDNGNTLHGGLNLSAEPAKVIFNVVNVNDAPAGVDMTLITVEDTPYQLKSFEFGFTDVLDNDQFYGIEVMALPVAGLLTLDGAPVDTGQVITVDQLDTGGLVYTPATDTTGTGYNGVGFRVIDNGGTDNGGVDRDQTGNSISFDVPGVNDSPQLRLQEFVLNEGGDFLISVNELSGNDPDDLLPSDLTFTIDAGPLNGSILLDNRELTAGNSFSLADIVDGRIAYIHNGSETAADYMDLTLSDGGEDGAVAATGRLTMVVREVIDPAPTPVDDSLLLNFGQPFSSVSGDLLDSGYAVLGQNNLQSHENLVVTLEVPPAYGVVELNSDGTFSYVHDGSLSMSDEFSYRITNEDGVFAIASVKVSVVPPVASAFAEGEVEVTGAVAERPELSQSKVEETRQPEATESTIARSETQALDPAMPDDPFGNADQSSVLQRGSTVSVELDPVDAFEPPLFYEHVQEAGQRDYADKVVAQHSSQGEKGGSDSEGLNLELSEDFYSILLEMPMLTPMSEVARQSGFVDGLDEIENTLENRDEPGFIRNQLVIESVMAISITTTAGLLATVLRGGALAASVLAIAPLWQGLDVIRYVDRTDKANHPDKKLSAADEKVEELFE